MRKWKPGDMGGRGEMTMVGDESGKSFYFFKYRTETIGFVLHTYHVNQRRKSIQKRVSFIQLCTKKRNLSVGYWWGLWFTFPGAEVFCTDLCTGDLSD